jgi:lipopolysaccharide transport system ATP-binding protein
MSDIAIRVDELSKRYKITAARYRHDTLRDQVMDSLKSAFRRNGSTQPGSETFWALRNVSFEVKQGELVGIIGRNGAGKSTLLKILSRITEPTSGRASIYGRVGSLLEVGTGFDHELTGRENIYLSGAILGMRKAEIDRKFDEIVAFSDVEKFIDTPVKRYSSGMYVRLAFAVAAHLEPEILLLDEVLAVGDAAFQRKCLGKMNDVAKEGRTILFVSHNMGAITRFCQWGIWLERGEAKACASAEEIVARYLGSGMDTQAEISFSDDPQHAPGNENVRVLAVRVRNNERQIASSLDMRCPFAIEVEYRILRRVSNLRIGYRLLTHEGVVVLSSTDTDGRSEGVERLPGRYLSTTTIPGNFFNAGRYVISLGADIPMVSTQFTLERILGFTVEQTGGIAGHISDGRLGILRLQLPWKTEILGDTSA